MLSKLDLESSSLDFKIQKEMFELAKNIAIDLGIKIGAAKYDMILTNNGPRVIEMTVRLQEDLIINIWSQLHQVKILKAAIYTSLTIVFKKLLVDSKKKVLSESIWPKPGIIKNIHGIDNVKKFKGFNLFFSI